MLSLEAVTDGRWQSQSVVEVANVRPAHGRLFEPTGERDLYPTLRTLAARLPGVSRTGALLIPEVAGPFGVADLVAVIGAQKRLESRLAANVRPLLSEGDCALVVACGRRGVSKWELPSLVHKPEIETMRRVSRLVSAGALESSSTGRVRRVEGIVPIGRVWALEAKLTSWSRALSQALRYSLWADGAGAVLGHLPSSSNKEAKGRADSMGVGLAQGSSWLLRPRVHKHPESRRLWASEHILAALTGL